MAMPSVSNKIPVTRFNFFSDDLFAIYAPIRAQISVNITQITSTAISGTPPIAKCEIAPVKAVKVITKTLVPTAVLSSYPKILVKANSIIIPPPTPANPQVNPITQPKIID